MSVDSHNAISEGPLQAPPLTLEKNNYCSVRLILMALRTGMMI